MTISINLARYLYFAMTSVWQARSGDKFLFCRYFPLVTRNESMFHLTPVNFRLRSDFMESEVNIL